MWQRMRLGKGKQRVMNIDWMKTFGKHWGVICRDKLNEMIDVVVGQFDTTTQFYQVRRVIKNYIQSCRRSKLGDNYSHKVGKLLNKIFSMRDKCNHSAFIPDDVFRKILGCVGLDNPIIMVNQ